MAIINKDGINGKMCSVCDIWKPLTEFPLDRTHNEDSQGGRHCRCRICKNRKERERRQRLKRRT